MSAPSRSCNWKRWRKVALTIAGGAIAVVAVVARVIHVGIVEAYSPDWIAESSVEARADGILVRALRATPDTLQWKGVAYVLTDSWIEETSRLEYKLLMWQRRERTGRYRLVVRLEPYPATLPDSLVVPMMGGVVNLYANDSIVFTARRFDGLWYTMITPPFPASVDLSWREKIDP